MYLNKLSIISNLKKKLFPEDNISKNSGIIEQIKIAENKTVLQPRNLKIRKEIYNQRIKLAD